LNIQVATADFAKFLTNFRTVIYLIHDYTTQYEFFLPFIKLFFIFIY